MKRLALIALVACHSDARFATLHERESIVRDAEQVEYSALANGLRVAVLRDPRAAIASIDLRFDAGVADDTKPGLALLVGELLAARGSDAELTTALDVDLDRTDIAVTAFDVDRAVDAAAHRLEPTCEDFDPYALDAARERATRALTGVSPSLAAAVWGSDHPYAHGAGDPQALAALTADDVCAFFRAHYGAGNATLVVTGALDASFEKRFAARMQRVPITELAPRRAIAAVTPGVVRAAVWGLAKPTAAFVYPVPSLDAQDDAMAELVLREALTWDPNMHAALLGARRQRVLLLALEGERQGELPQLRAKLRGLVEAEYSADIDARTTPEDSLDAAQELDDPFHRGGDIAELVASAPQRIDRLARVHAWLAVRWLNVHMAAVKPRELELYPGGAGGNASIEALADPANVADRDLAAARAPLTAIPVRAAPRPVIEYKLASGLRVVLAPDARSPIVDARLVVPIGRRAEREPGTATPAATELEAMGRSDWDENDKLLWYGKRETIQDATVTPGYTQFRAVGFADLAEWHVWALAYRVANGEYEHATGALARWRAHYVPAGATLIVSGSFDPAAIRRVIDRWLGPWRATDAAPVANARGPARPDVELTDDGTLWLDLGYALPAGAKTPRSTALVLAALVQQRLGGLRGMMDAAITYDAGDRRLAITGEMDPRAVLPALGLVEHELARLRTEPVTAGELERARRIAIASHLGGELGASGRAHRLVERVIAGDPLDGTDSIAAETATLGPDDIRAAAAELFDRANADVSVRAAKPLADRALAALGIDPSTAGRH